MIVLLDSGVLGLLASPLQRSLEIEDSEIYQCTEWFYSLLARGVQIASSDISDYEVRRELIRIDSQGLVILDNFRNDKIIDFLPITPEVLTKAAEFWAEVRQNNIPTSDDKNIDADMIISAHWDILSQTFPGRGVFIATKNLKHLRIFAREYAQEWMNIKA